VKNDEPPVWEKISGNQPPRWRVSRWGRSLTLEIRAGMTKIFHISQEEALKEGLSWTGAREWALRWLLQDGVVEKNGETAAIFCRCGKTFTVQTIDFSVGNNPRCPSCGTEFGG
jgi:hypothetical protein